MSCLRPLRVLRPRLALLCFGERRALSVNGRPIRNAPGGHPLNLALSALAAAALATSALAQPPRPAPLVVEKDPAKIMGGAYVVEPSHTRVMFAVSHKGFTTWYGQFTHAAGTLNLDTKTPAASTFDITVPTETITTTNTTLDEELRSKVWMDATAYPTIEFKSGSVKTTG